VYSNSGCVKGSKRRGWSRLAGLRACIYPSRKGDDDGGASCSVVELEVCSAGEVQESVRCGCQCGCECVGECSC
jgi:hypothetical protein